MRLLCLHDHLHGQRIQAGDTVVEVDAGGGAKVSDEIAERYLLPDQEGWQLHPDDGGPSPPQDENGVLDMQLAVERRPFGIEDAVAVVRDQARMKFEAAMRPLTPEQRRQVFDALTGVARTQAEEFITELQLDVAPPSAPAEPPAPEELVSQPSSRAVKKKAVRKKRKPVRRALRGDKPADAAMAR